MDVPKTLQRQLEISFVKSLIAALRTSKLKKASAQLLMEQFMKLRPYADSDDMKTKITRFVAGHPTFADLSLIVQQFDDYQNTQSVIEKMRSHMKAGAHDKAVEVALKKT
ncbi:MAG: hypothetical protein ACOCXQ_02370 [Patescibacteria group bacterium]